MLVLGLDLAGVVAVGIAAAADRRPGGVAQRATWTAAASAVGFVTWIPAAIAIGMRAAQPDSRSAQTRARRLVLLGWTANTAGTVTVAALAAVAEGPGSRPAVVAGALAVGGAAASAAYLELL